MVLVGSLSVRNIIIGIEINAMSVIIDTAIGRQCLTRGMEEQDSLDCVRTLVKPWSGLVRRIAQARSLYGGIPYFSNRLTLNEVVDGDINV